MILDFFEKLLFPLEHTPKKTETSDIEKYVLSNNPQSLEDVERLQKQFLNESNKTARIYY